MSMIPMFSPADIDRDMTKWLKERELEMVQRLAYIGEEFANAARGKSHLQGSFHDRTGNLRASIGYVVAIDGEIQIQESDGKTPEGRAAGDNLGRDLVAKHSNGLVLIVYAGMDYAAAVESKGYDVITGTAPLRDELRELLRGKR